MVQSIDNSRPIYSAVKINIKKPEVNAGNNMNTYTDDNGIYNGVVIDIDNPSVNTAPKSIYSYPEAQNVVTYDMAHVAPIALPQDFKIAYHTANFIIPHVQENNVEPEAMIVVDEEVNDNIADNEQEIVIPQPNYTTIEAEKGNIPLTTEEPITEIGELEYIEQAEVAQPEVIAAEPDAVNIAENAVEVDNTIEEANVNQVEIKRPEIIPGEDIMPEVDIPLIISNLTNSNFDIQAQQMEEIARISLDNTENAVPYIVREVFSSLIDITKVDSTDLAAPTEEQVAARTKMIANYIAAENAKDGEVKLPYEISDQEIAMATELSPMEMAERNKEYALFTIAILAKVYTDEVEKQTGNIVPLTDLPGSAAIVDALRFNPNAGVKIAAIDALRHIQRPEYNEELTTLLTLAQADHDAQVSAAAKRAIEKINN